MPSEDDFYIGYLPKPSARLGKWLGRITGAILIGMLAVGLILAVSQPHFANSRFEFGEVRAYAGVIEEWPYPILRTVAGPYLLVAPGKHGLAVGGWQGKTVQLKGTLTERAADRMLEALPESIRDASPKNPGDLLDARMSLGTVTLRGEIVDSKCYLGVMNPGDGKVHRDCAARCISGGAPPAFVVRDSSGEARVLLLTGADGRSMNREVLDYVAEPLEISGELIRAGTQMVLRAEPSRYRRAGN